MIVEYLLQMNPLTLILIFFPFLLYALKKMGVFGRQTSVSRRNLCKL